MNLPYQCVCVYTNVAYKNAGTTKKHAFIGDLLICTVLFCDLDFQKIRTSGLHLETLHRGGKSWKSEILGGGGGGRHSLHPLYINHISQGARLRLEGSNAPPPTPLNETLYMHIPPYMYLPPTGSLGLPVTNWINCLCSTVSYVLSTSNRCCTAWLSWE